MKTILTLVLSLIMISSYSQYSAYYNVYKKVDVNQKVNISGNINTIDYGSLALANAQREKNRFENEKYLDEKERRISLEIASNPMKAYDYGEDYSYFAKNADKLNFKKFRLNFKILNSNLFTDVGALKVENVSIDGIKTQIQMYLPMYLKVALNIEDSLKFNRINIQQINEISSSEYGKIKAFVHKKDIERSTVFGVGGFLGTIIYEDDYQLAISDNYQSFSKDGIRYVVKVKYFGNKKDTNFEKLEGRRYYLRNVIEKYISSASITDYKIKD